MARTKNKHGKTQTEVMKYFQDKKNNLEPGTILYENGPDTELWYNLACIAHNHPEADELLLDWDRTFRIGICTTFKSKNYQAGQTTGNHNQFKLKKAVSGRDETPLGRLTIALRTEVYKYVGGLKKINGWIGKNAHHFEKEFKEIRELFVKEKNLDIKSVEYDESGKKLKDRQLAQEWWVFHKNHSKLMPVDEEEHYQLHHGKEVALNA